MKDISERNQFTLKETHQENDHTWNQLYIQIINRTERSFHRQISIANEY